MRCCRYKRERDPEGVKGLGIPDTDKIDCEDGENDKRYLDSQLGNHGTRT